MSDQKPENQSGAGPQNPRRDEWPDRDMKQNGREWRHTWGRGDPFRGLFPGLVLILVGVLLFLVIQEYLSWGNWWHYLLIGLGLIFLLDGTIHYLHPDFRNQGFGKLIPGVILVLVGLAFALSFSDWWPLILVGAGLAILLGMLFRRR